MSINSESSIVFLHHVVGRSIWKWSLLFGQVTPEIHRELLNSRNRGQKDDTNMGAPVPMKVEKAVVEEDMWNLPEVQIGMEED